MIKKNLAALLSILVLFCGCKVPTKKQETKSISPGGAPLGMVWIPGGEFTMGSKEEKPDFAAQPLHTARVDGFWMDETEVTNEQFRKFVVATGYKTVAEKKPDWEDLRKQVAPGTPKPADNLLQPGAMVFSPPPTPVMLNDYSQWWTWVLGADWQHPEGPGSSITGNDKYPVVQVAYDDALAYATWAGKRLPTEAEYEFAARGGINGKTFAWGDELNPQGKYLANYFQGSFPNKDTGADGFIGPSPVKSFPPNGYGLYDIVGNVWELCSDWYAIGSSVNDQPLTNPKGPAKTMDPDDAYAIKHVSKGGSFLCSIQYCSNYKPSGRQGTAFDSGMNHMGFRCVKD